MVYCSMQQQCSSMHSQHRLVTHISSNDRVEESAPAIKDEVENLVLLPWKAEEQGAGDGARHKQVDVVGSLGLHLDLQALANGALNVECLHTIDQLASHGPYEFVCWSFGMKS